MDAVRWAALLSQRKHKEGPELLDLEVVKTNYARRPPILTLCRPDDWGGAMRVALDDELEAGAAADADLSGLYQSIAQDPASGAELARRLGARKEDVLAGVSRLAASGKIKRHGNLWRITATVPAVPNGSRNPDCAAVPAVPSLKREGNRRGTTQSCAESLGTGTENQSTEQMP